MSGVDPAQFRQLLGRFATGVTVVTTRDPAGRPVGMTASSVASVSLEPPLVLVSVDRKNDMYPALQAAKRFVLNVLAADQEAISRRFAAEHPNRFDGIGYRESKHGIPLLEGVLASIECEKQAETPGGITLCSSGWSPAAPSRTAGLCSTTAAATPAWAAEVNDRHRAAGRSTGRCRPGRKTAPRHRAPERALRRDAGGGPGTRPAVSSGRS